jgi:hypothetical protein
MTDDRRVILSSVYSNDCRPSRDSAFERQALVQHARSFLHPSDHNLRREGGTAEGRARNITGLIAASACHQIGGRTHEVRRAEHLRRSGRRRPKAGGDRYAVEAVQDNRFNAIFGTATVRHSYARAIRGLWVGLTPSPRQFCSIYEGRFCRP